MLLRNPCKNLKSYDNPFWGKSNKAWKSAVILPEEWGYIAGRVRLYSQKSVVIWPEECGYIPRKSAVICVKMIIVVPSSDRLTA